MKMHNFTIRGNCLEIVGRIERRGPESIPVYDIEFPEGMDSMSLQELRDFIRRIEEDIDELFYYDGEIRDSALCKFEKAWNKDGEDEDDAHGA